MKLTLMNKTSFIGFEEGAAVVEKHLRKMIRKCLMLTIDAQTSTQKANSQTLLASRLPSHLHVASIMNEKTNEEKQTFGKVNFTEMKQI